MIRTDRNWVNVILYSLVSGFFWAEGLAYGGIYIFLALLWAVLALWYAVSPVTLKLEDDQLVMSSFIWTRNFPVKDIFKIELTPNAVVVDTKRRKIRFGGWLGIYTKPKTLVAIGDALSDYAKKHNIPVEKPKK